MKSSRFYLLAMVLAIIAPTVASAGEFDALFERITALPLKSGHQTREATLESEASPFHLTSYQSGEGLPDSDDDLVEVVWVIPGNGDVSSAYGYVESNSCERPIVMGCQNQSCAQSTYCSATPQRCQLPRSSCSPCGPCAEGRNGRFYDRPVIHGVGTYLTVPLREAFQRPREVLPVGQGFFAQRIFPYITWRRGRYCDYQTMRTLVARKKIRHMIIGGVVGGVVGGGGAVAGGGGKKLAHAGMLMLPGW